MNNTSTSFTWKYIVEGMQQGDNTAFDAFYNLTYSKLKKRILFKTGFNEQDAEDLLQETYIRVFSRINDLKDPEAVIGWTNTICDSIYLDHVKKENRRAGIANVVNESAMQSQDDDTDDFSLAMIADPDADIEALIEQQEVQNILREIISSLPDMYRSCVELQMSDKSVKEIAQELQLNENTAKTLIRRAKMQIKDKVLDLEKRGTKLYGVAPLVFFVWVYRIWMAKSEYLPTGSAAALSDLASASATAKDIANINSFSNNDKGLTNGKPNFSKGLYAQRHTDLEFGTNAEYKADISDITEELKIHDQPQGITEKLNRGRKSANVTNTAPNTDGTATAAAARGASAGAISAAGTAGLGTGKIIAIVAAGVVAATAITIGTVIAVNNNRNNNSSNEITYNVNNDNTGNNSNELNNDFSESSKPDGISGDSVYNTESEESNNDNSRNQIEIPERDDLYMPFYSIPTDIAEKYIDLLNEIKDDDGYGGNQIDPQKYTYPIAFLDSNEDTIPEMIICRELINYDTVLGQKLEIRTANINIYGRSSGSNVGGALLNGIGQESCLLYILQNSKYYIISHTTYVNGENTLTSDYEYYDIGELIPSKAENPFDYTSGNTPFEYRYIASVMDELSLEHYLAKEKAYGNEPTFTKSPYCNIAYSDVTEPSDEELKIATAIYGNSYNESIIILNAGIENIDNMFTNSISMGMSYEEAISYLESFIK